MIRHLGVHGPNDSDVIDVRGGSGEDLTDFYSGLAVFSELKWRRKCRSCLSLCQQVVTDWLPGKLGQHRLGVESVDMRRSTVQKEMNDSPGAGREMWCAVIERPGASFFFDCPALLLQQTRQAK